MHGGNGCLWKEFGGETLFRVDFRKMVLLKDESQWGDGDDPIRGEWGNEGKVVTGRNGG